MVENDKTSDAVDPLPPSVFPCILPRCLAQIRFSSSKSCSSGGAFVESTGQHFDRTLNLGKKLSGNFVILHQIENFLVEGGKLFAVSLEAFGTTSRWYRDEFRCA